MAKAEVSVILALREAANKLEKSSCYQWGHMGQCNCGFLVQVVTGRTAAHIHTTAMTGSGDWSEQLNDYCQTSGLAMDSLIDELLAAGFNREDLACLERLSDPDVLSGVPANRRPLIHNRKEDAIIYLRAWAYLLEEQWASTQPVAQWGAFTDELSVTEKVYSPFPHLPG